MHRSLVPHCLCALPVAISLLLLAGCGGEEPASDAPEVHEYTTRGVVVSLPRWEDAGSQLQIRHEAIPEFRDAGGEVVGMESMTMPFPAEEALLVNIAAGDKVEFDFEVSWTGSPPLRVTRIAKLPPETRLGFESRDQDSQEPKVDDASE